MSTKSAAEEIEELRAKAIASMPSSSANPSSGPRSRSSQSKEEGELSPSEDAASEPPTYSGALPNATILEEQAPMVSVDDHVQAKSGYVGEVSLLAGPVVVVVVDRAEVEDEVEAEVRRYLPKILMLSWTSTIKKQCKSTKKRGIAVCLRLGLIA